MKHQIVQALRAQAVYLRAQALGKPPVVQLAMTSTASEYENIADNMEAGVIQLRQTGQMKVIK